MSDVCVTLVFPARPEYLLLARLALTGLTRLVSADEESVADLRLAVTEAASNVCRHAYPDGSGNVTISYRLTAADDRLEVTVEDDGPGFDEDAVTDWRPDRLADGGMGLAIIRAVADDVELSRGGSGSRLRFTRSLR